MESFYLIAVLFKIFICLICHKVLVIVKIVSKTLCYNTTILKYTIVLLILIQAIILIKFNATCRW